MQETTLFKDKINYKLPNGNGFLAHVDYHAYSHIGEIPHLTANIAIDPATLANGCLEVVPGSHRMQIEFAEGGRIAPAWENTKTWVPVPLESGDVLFFGSMLAHRSERNRTEKSRSSLYATFCMKGDGVGLRDVYYEHRRRAFPPDHGMFSLSLLLLMDNMLILATERDANMDYGDGWKQYGFAAPFSKDDTAKTA